MSDKLIPVELTEREWDHVQIAVEESIVQLVKIAANRAIDSLPYYAVARSADRFESIANKVAGQVDAVREADELGENPWKGSEVHTEES